MPVEECFGATRIRQTLTSLLLFCRSPEGAELCLQLRNLCLSSCVSLCAGSVVPQLLISDLCPGHLVLARCGHVISFPVQEVQHVAGNQCQLGTFLQCQFGQSLMCRKGLLHKARIEGGKCIGPSDSSLSGMIYLECQSWNVLLLLYVCLALWWWIRSRVSFNLYFPP